MRSDDPCSARCLPWTGPSWRGDSIQGDLTTSNPIQGGGRRVEVWEFAANAGSRLRVDLQSEDFDPFLFVVGPGLGAGLRNDDGGDRLNASLCFTPASAEGYRVVAAALDGGNWSVHPVGNPVVLARR